MMKYVISTYRRAGETFTTMPFVPVAPGEGNEVAALACAVCAVLGFDGPSESTVADVVFQAMRGGFAYFEELAPELSLLGGVYFPADLGPYAVFCDKAGNVTGACYLCSPLPGVEQDVWVPSVFPHISGVWGADMSTEGMDVPKVICAANGDFKGLRVQLLAHLDSDGRVVRYFNTYPKKKRRRK